MSAFRSPEAVVVVVVVRQDPVLVSRPTKNACLLSASLLAVEQMLSCAAVVVVSARQKLPGEIEPRALVCL